MKAFFFPENLIEQTSVFIVMEAILLNQIITKKRKRLEMKYHIPATSMIISHQLYPRYI